MRIGLFSRFLLPSLGSQPCQGAAGLVAWGPGPRGLGAGIFGPGVRCMMSADNAKTTLPLRDRRLQSILLLLINVEDISFCRQLFKGRIL